MEKFFERVKELLDDGNDVVLSSNNNGYVAMVKHEFEYMGSVTIIDYNENTNKMNETNVLADTLSKYL